ncbi:hypothetical protein TIFTF001_015510 [Ficus carica]|uniref:Uncharacterized protein n=1 Tax=Ficus carica TaxID=3494 RepID=A0AA88A869_FICCA|nr:hypothetical protein TIFTF001_015510 [Ficus carica]
MVTGSLPCRRDRSCKVRLKASEVGESGDARKRTSGGCRSPPRRRNRRLETGERTTRNSAERNSGGYSGRVSSLRARSELRRPAKAEARRWSGSGAKKKSSNARGGVWRGICQNDLTTK